MSSQTINESFVCLFTVGHCDEYAKMPLQFEDSSVCSESSFTRRDLLFRIQSSQSCERKWVYELSSPAFENNCKGMQGDPVITSLTEKDKLSGRMTINL
jgi:hypothetical protein